MPFSNYYNELDLKQKIQVENQLDLFLQDT